MTPWKSPRKREAQFWSGMKGEGGIFFNNLALNKEWKRIEWLRACNGQM